MKAASGASCVGLTADKTADIADCRDQLYHWSDYACDAPQIAADQGSRAVGGSFALPATPGSPMAVSFLLTNVSTGNQDLVIDHATILGDPRCAFGFDPARDLERKTIPPGGSTFLRLTYEPPAAGPDTAGVRIHSNAQNYKQLDLWVCGAPPSPGADGGVDVLGAWPEVGFGSIPCEDPGEVIAPCHQ